MILLVLSILSINTSVQSKCFCDAILNYCDKQCCCDKECPYSLTKEYENKGICLFNVTSSIDCFKTTHVQFHYENLFYKIDQLFCKTASNDKDTSITSCSPTSEYLSIIEKYNSAEFINSSPQYRPVNYKYTTSYQDNDNIQFLKEINNHPVQCCSINNVTTFGTNAFYECSTLSADCFTDWIVHTTPVRSSHVSVNKVCLPTCTVGSHFILRLQILYTLSPSPFDFGGVINQVNVVLDANTTKSSVEVTFQDVSSFQLSELKRMETVN